MSDEVGVASMKTLVGMKVPMSFTSMMVMHPCRKVSSTRVVGLFGLSRFLMRL